MKREEIANVVDAKSAARVERHRQFIQAAPSVSASQSRFRDAVASLPGVANDPHTVDHVLMLAEAMITCRQELAVKAARAERRMGW